ncbi:MAG: hypothetical protein IJM59_12075 [Proteobacteria bacterium]|nr:hypothetical protein [Pseudomonadota bacterium]
MNSKKIWLTSLCIALFANACGGDGKDNDDDTPANPLENTAILCSDSLDNDNNGFKDCEDQNCKSFVFCSQAEDGKENTLATCQDKADNDGDGKTDCDDEECQAFALCQNGTVTIVENTSALCQDGIDNDSNGAKDCDDPGCQEFAFCAEAEPDKENTLATCQDKEDNDSDGKVDCDDPECQAFTICNNGGADLSQEGAESTVAACYFDGIDNDGDTLIDCDDPNCKIYTFCQNLGTDKENTQTTCTDEKDNDDDGYIDCDDPDCANVAACAKGQVGSSENTLTTCTDEKDNDDDGYIDCDDPDCAAVAACAKGQVGSSENTQTTCTDEKDNDDDGYIDCDDPDCAAVAACTKDAGGNAENTQSKCTDGLDNDGDGDLDCLDADCQAFAICQSQVGVVENTRELCTDGKDNDFNGKTDKDDPNCALFYTAGGQYGENTVTLCGDGKDNDGDGVKDCDDPECQVFDICMTGFDKDNDECKDDPYKFKKDTCKCGETLVGTDCYTNIAKPDDFLKLSSNATGKFIIKQDIEFGKTDRDPIKASSFKGTLDGNNKRITGVFNQTAILIGEENYYCGLFSSLGNSSNNATVKNIDIAITLNCSNKDHADMSLYAGAISGSIGGKASNITGSSKVYVEETTEISSPKNTQNIYKNVGALFGSAMNADLSDITVTGNVSAQLRNAKFKTDSANKTYYLFIGGVAGRARSLSNIQANNFITLKRKGSVTNYSTYEYTGGVAGYVGGDVNNVSNQGVIKFLPIDTNTSSFLGGIAGYVSSGSIANSSFTGMIETNSTTPSKNKIEIGGIAGFLTQDSTDKKNYGIDHCQTNATLIIKTPAYIGGILGYNSQPERYIRNCSSVIDLDLSSSGDSVYYGGILGYTYSPTTYIVNNSSRTNYTLPDAVFTSYYTTRYYHLFGISGYSGIVVNNFASDKLICPEDECKPAFTTSSDGTAQAPMAIGGSYVYESYWNKAIFGNESGASSYSDASAEPYTYNLAGVPVTRTGKTVLGLLRYNSGHDGGVLSAHIPANIGGIYYNWTTVNDNDDHEIPVPADK